MMDSWTFILTSLVIGLVYYLFKRKNVFDELDIPHDPPLPLIGSMGSCLMQQSNIVDVIQKLYKKFPDAKYMGFYDFGTPVIMLRDPELIKSIAIKNFDNFPDHRGFTDEERDPLMAKNLFSLKGDEWKEMRGILSPSFTSSKMKMMFHLMTECAKNFTNVIIERSKEKDYIADMKDIFTRISADVISSCAFGISIDSMRDPKNQLYTAGRTATDFEGLLSLKMLLIRNFKLLTRLIGMKIVSDSTSRFFTDVISSNVNTRREKGITRPDFLQLMMEGKEKNSGTRELTIEEMTANAFIFFFGGLDTVSTQLCFIVHEIAVDEKMQARLQNEIDAILKKSEGEPSYSDINGLTYLDAVMNEGLRFYPQATLLDRICKDKFELPPPLPGKSPVTIEPGMNIWIPVCSIHHDPNFYENPEKFDPERFLGDNKINNNSPTYLPFGIGPRMCIGNRFALLEMKIILFHLLARCNIRVCSKTQIPLKMKKNTFIMLPEGGFWLRFELRK